MFAHAGSLLALALATGAAPSPLEVRRAWEDGQAELNGYALKQPRYGQIRSGSAVLIYVTEPFSESARVKADPGRHPPSDEVPVLKLNLVKDFQTGVYDYNLMSSVFVALDPRLGRRAGAPVKSVFSAQEWCGAMFEELLFDAKEIRQQRNSYFDGEGDQTGKLPYPDGGVTADELPILVRALPTALLQPGESKEVPMLPSLERLRLIHKPLAWQTAKLERSAKTSKVDTPLGKLEAETWTVTLTGGDRHEYTVEVAHPRRLLGWRGPEGEEATILGSKRMKYWELHGEGDEKHLEALGLKPPRSR